MMLEFLAPRVTTSKLTVIAGKTTELGVPTSKRVRVYSRANGSLLASTKSNEAGEYKLYLPNDMAYTVISIDGYKKFNGVIQDNVVPK